MSSPWDICHCGDYRRSHVEGTGRCQLDDLCTPGRCQKFRLACTDAAMREAEAEQDAIRRREGPSEEYHMGTRP